jgi:hypothetical protein
VVQGDIEPIRSSRGKHDPMGMPLQGISQDHGHLWVVFYDQNPHG